MDIYPSSAEEKLGFDVIRGRLEHFARGPLGQERIREMWPSKSLDWVEEELARVAELQEAFRYDDPVPLENMLDIREVLRQAAPEDAFVAPEKLLAVQRMLVAVRRLKGYFDRRKGDYPRLHRSAGRFTPLKELEDHISRIVDEGGGIRDSASSELRRIRRTIDRKEVQVRRELRRALQQARSEGHAAEDNPTIRAGRRVIPVRAAAKRKVEGFVQDVSASGQTVYIEPAACVALNNELRELEADERREIERLLREVAGRMRTHLDTLQDNVRGLAQFDLLQAKARLANELEAVVPSLNEEGRVDVREGRNPLLYYHFRRQAGKGEEPQEIVPLNLEMGKDYNTLVITGPNAGGKTVSMKTVGLFAVMLAYGLPLPLRPDSQFGLFEKLLVDIGDEQSIEQDLSTFSSHVSNLKHMLSSAGPSTLVLIDEAGTGTDPDEGGALAQAVLEELTRRGARTIATTHHGTLKVYAHEAERVENGSMEFDQATLRPTYRFQTGTPGSSYAFEIARRLGLDAPTLERAQELVGRQKRDMEELITTFEARTQELEDELAEVRRTREQADKDRRQYEERLGHVKKERDEIRQQALEEAERIVQGANARIEETIREIKEAEAEREATRKARERLEEYAEDVQEEQVETKERREARRRQRGREEEKEQAAPEPEGKPIEVAGPLQEGDQVVIDGGSTKGEILEIEDGEAVVRLGAMRMRTELDRLTRVGGAREQQVTVQAPTGGDEDLPVMSVRPSVDLRGQRVEEARREVTRLIDEALAADLERIDILHGKGTGALREAIHEYLATRSEVAHFEEAPIQEGGAGVTYVYLK